MRFRVVAIGGLVIVVAVAFSILNGGDDENGAVVDGPTVDEKAELVAEAGVEADADAMADAVGNAETDADGSATKTPARRAERKRRARTQNTQRQPARSRAKGISSEDPLGDLVPPL